MGGRRPRVTGSTQKSRKKVLKAKRVSTTPNSYTLWGSRPSGSDIRAHLNIVGPGRSIKGGGEFGMKLSQRGEINDKELEGGNTLPLWNVFKKVFYWKEGSDQLGSSRPCQEESQARLGLA